MEKFYKIFRNSVIFLDIVYAYCWSLYKHDRILSDKKDIMIIIIIVLSVILGLALILTFVFKLLGSNESAKCLERRRQKECAGLTDEEIAAVTAVVKSVYVAGKKCPVCGKPFKYYSETKKETVLHTYNVGFVGDMPVTKTALIDEENTYTHCSCEICGYSWSNDGPKLNWGSFLGKYFEK